MLDQAAGGTALTPPKEGLIRVVVPISKNTTEIDWIGPEAVFESWHRDPTTRRPSPKFEIVTAAETLDRVGDRIPRFTFATVPSPHVVVIPAQNGSPALLEWLKKVAVTADVTMSVCTGARLLATAGLLNGLRATTHHESIDAFEKEFPDVKWVRDVRFVENTKISTAAGLTSGIDLALRVVDRYFGRDAAQGVADHVEHEGKRWIVG
jgi:transcriptional regulator GlxA family with amidase domain